MSATVAVCGFPRSGSSMLMRMLDAGGISPVIGSADRSYELAGGLADFAEFDPTALAGRSVKLLDYLLWFDELPAADWRFIWSDRDPVEQAKSTIKLMSGAGVPVAKSGWKRLAKSYGPDRLKVLDRMRERGPVFTTSYETLLRSPRVAAERIAEFLVLDFGDLDRDAMSNVPTARSVRCAPGLDFEMGRAS